MTEAEAVEHDRKQVIDKSTNGVDYILSWITLRLNKMGFEVKRKYIIEGEGGVHHTLDLLALASPIPGLEIRIGFVVHREILTINDVERFIAWRNELPVDKIALIVLSDIDPEAYELAKHYGIDIIRPVEELKLDLSKAKSYKFFSEEYFKPKINVNDAIELMKKGHSILRRRRKISSCALVYLPLIVIEAQISETDPFKTETRLVNTKLVFDGVQGYLVTREGETIGIDEVLGKFSDLSEEAINILRVISKEGTATLNDIEEAVGVLGEKLRAILGRLAEKSLIDLFGDMAEIRYSILAKTFDPLELVHTIRAEILKGVPDKSRGIIVLEPKAFISKFIELVEALNGHIEKVTIVYYPLYVGLLEENNGKQQKLVIIDGLTGVESKSLYKILGEIEILRTIENESISIGECGRYHR